MIDVLCTGSATAIGSLPHHDPVDAAGFVLERLPALPAAPSLPNRSPAEGMLGQAVSGVPGVHVDADGRLVVDVERLDPAGVPEPDLDGDSFAGLRAFLHAVHGRRDPVKVQLTGPVTLGLALHRAGAPVETAFAVAGAATRSLSSALLARTAAAAPHATPVVFFDEPGLVALPRAGFPLPLDDAIDLLSGALAAVERVAITGVHCCGATDWGAVVRSGPAVLSLPVATASARAAGTLAGHLDRGGWIAWGAVPTDGPLGTSADLLWRRLGTLWCELVEAGCDPVRLRAQALVTPACGLAGHGRSQADRVLGLTRNLAARIHDQASAARFSIGA